MKGKLHLIQEDLRDISVERDIVYPGWVDEGYCKIEAMLESYRLFHEKFGA